MESRLDKDKEHIWIAGLTRNNSIKYIELVHLGTIDKCTVGIKDILRTAVYYCCSSIIMCHNHPGGTIKPSSNDFRVTRAVKEAANILEINLLDSIIIGNYYYSFSENNVL
jgi:DNA repair protein RadC